MKIITHLAIFSIVLFAFTSCKSKKNAAATSSSNTAQQQTTITPPAEDSYPLVVEFYSEASGIDGKSQDEFLKFLESYPKKIAYSPTHWGREGEVDYCLKLSELSTSEQADFVKKAKETLINSKLVHINENAKCVHKH